MATKNIIFDLGNVLFDYNYIDLRQAHIFPEINPFKPIENGFNILQNCLKQKDDNGQKTYKIYVLSNWSKISYSLLERHHPETLRLFDGIVTSGEVGVKKPDRKIYEHLLIKYNLNAQDCIFIDDQQENIDMAERLGITGILCNEFSRVEYHLKRLKIY